MIWAQSARIPSSAMERGALGLACRTVCIATGPAGRRVFTFFLSHFTFTHTKMTIFRVALASLLLASSQAKTPDNVSSRLMIHVSYFGGYSSTMQCNKDPGSAMFVDRASSLHFGKSPELS